MIKNNTDFTTAFLVGQTSKEVFNAINNVREWWSDNIEGDTEKLNDEFNYHYQDVHTCKMKLVEVVPDQRVVWLVLENYFNFTKDSSEWTGTRIVFDISKQADKTKLTFTHEGLVPEYECFDICKTAWTDYINGSLYGLITTGEGLVSRKDEINHKTLDMRTRA
jgi:hypothetical protein